MGHSSVHSLTGHVAGHAVLALCIVLVILGIFALAMPRHRGRIGRFALWLVGGLIAVYLVIRAVVEFFIIRYGDPASYHNSWGGPSLVGVFLVHSGPGFLILLGSCVYLARRRRTRRLAR